MASKKTTRTKPVPPPPPVQSVMLHRYEIGTLWARMYEAVPEWFRDLPQGTTTPPHGKGKGKSAVTLTRKGGVRTLRWAALKPTGDTNNAFIFVEWSPSCKGARVSVALNQAGLILSRDKDLRHDDETAAVERVLIADPIMGGADAIETAAAVAFLANALLKELRTKGGSCAKLGARLDSRREKLEGLLSGKDLVKAKGGKGWTIEEQMIISVIVEAVQSMMNPERKPPHTRTEIMNRLNDRFRDYNGRDWNLSNTGKVLKRLGLDWI